MRNPIAKIFTHRNPRFRRIGIRQVVLYLSRSFTAQLIPRISPVNIVSKVTMEIAILISHPQLQRKLSKDVLKQRKTNKPWKKGKRTANSALLFSGSL